VFSDNYAEHQKNVARLRGIEHSNGSPPAPAVPANGGQNGTPNGAKP
jgi:hypothetical protein